MVTAGVGAVVVTYHPDAEVAGNLRALAGEVGRLVVVDNGSSAGELEVLRGVQAECGFEIVENGSNLGIATALNVGVRRLREQECAWVLLFDQDSRVRAGFGAAMLAGFEGSVWGARLGILVPRYVDARLGKAIPPNLVAEGLEAAMTSGSLLRVGTFAELGYFVDALFIDGVDYEYSLRLRGAGYVIAECAEAELLHRPGEPKQHRLLGFDYQTANYSPIRRYYQERNKVWIARRYFGRFPVFCAKLFLFSSKDFVKILVAEEESGEKARYFLRGVWDGVRGRMGKREG